MVEIIKEPTAINNASEIKSKQVLLQSKRIEAQQPQKGSLDSLNKYRFEIVSKTRCEVETEKYISRQTRTKKTGPSSIADIAECCSNLENAWHMAKPAATAMNNTAIRGCGDSCQNKEGNSAKDQTTTQNAQKR